MLSSNCIHLPSNHIPMASKNSICISLLFLVKLLPQTKHWSQIFSHPTLWAIVNFGISETSRCFWYLVSFSQFNIRFLYIFTFWNLFFKFDIISLLSPNHHLLPHYLLMNIWTTFCLNLL
jgi:hypothetical protein